MFDLRLFPCKGPRFKGTYSTTLSGDRAIAVAEQHVKANDEDGTDNPLFMYLAFQVSGPPTHLPTTPPYSGCQGWCPLAMT